jgi:hypothetical protein
LLSKEEQRSPPAWRSSKTDNVPTSDPLQQYHSRQRAAAMAWLETPPTQRERSTPLAEILAVSSSAPSYGLILGPPSVSLDEEPIASRHMTPFHRPRQPNGFNRPTPLYARTPQGRIPSLDTSSWRSDEEDAATVRPDQPTPSNPLATLEFPSHPPTQTAGRSSGHTLPRRTGRTVAQARSDHLDDMLEDVQRRRHSSATFSPPDPPS